MHGHRPDVPGTTPLPAADPHDPGALGSFGRWLGEIRRQMPEHHATREARRFVSEAQSWVRQVETTIHGVCATDPATLDSAVAIENAAAAVANIKRFLDDLPTPAASQPLASDVNTDASTASQTERSTAREQLRARTAAWREQVRQEREAQRRAAAQERRAYVERLRTADPSTPAAAPSPDAGGPIADKPVDAAAEPSATPVETEPSAAHWPNFAFTSFTTAALAPGDEIPASASSAATRKPEAPAPRFAQISPAPSSPAPFSPAPPPAQPEPLGTDGSLPAPSATPAASPAPAVRFRRTDRTAS